MATTSGNIIRAACRHFFEEVDEQVNVFHFTVNDIPATLNDALLLVDLAELIGTAYLQVDNYISSAIFASDISVYNVTQDYPLGTIDFGAGYTGGLATGDALPPGTSGIVLWRTATKRVLGKTYLPTFAESTQNRGSLDTAVRAAMSAFAGEMRTVAPGVNDYSFDLHVYSREAGQARPIVSSTAALKVGYQRRRKAGVGS